MSKFDEFMQSQNEAAKIPITGITIQGSFGCQHCFDCVDEAEYFQTKRLLKWVCEEGHVSYIEEFML